MEICNGCEHMTVEKGWIESQYCRIDADVACCLRKNICIDEFSEKVKRPAWCPIKTTVLVKILSIIETIYMIVRHGIEGAEIIVAERLKHEKYRKRKLGEAINEMQKMRS